MLRWRFSTCLLDPSRREVSAGWSEVEVIGPEGAAAALRSNDTFQLERRWANHRRAGALSILQGRSILRRGHFRID